MRYYILALFVWALQTVSAQDPSQTESAVKPNYQLASKFSPTKLRTMIFSTDVRPNWINYSDKFWYEYTTSEGKKWYIVDPAQKKKAELFDHAKMAAEITKIVQNPFDSQHLVIENLYFVLDNDNVLRIEVKSKRDTDKSREEIEELTNKKDTQKKKAFHYEYNVVKQKLRAISDTSKEKPVPSCTTFN